MRWYYVDEHGEANGWANEMVPLNSEVGILSFKERYKWRQIKLGDASIHNENHKSLKWSCNKEDLQCWWTVS